MLTISQRHELVTRRLKQVNTSNVERHRTPPESPFCQVLHSAAMKSSALALSLLCAIHSAACAPTQPAPHSAHAPATRTAHPDQVSTTAENTEADANDATKTAANGPKAATTPLEEAQVVVRQWVESFIAKDMTGLMQHSGVPFSFDGTSLNDETALRNELSKHTAGNVSLKIAGVEAIADWSAFKQHYKGEETDLLAFVAHVAMNGNQESIIFFVRRSEPPKVVGLKD